MVKTLKRKKKIKAYEKPIISISCRFAAQVTLFDRLFCMRFFACPVAFWRQVEIDAYASSISCVCPDTISNRSFTEQTKAEKQRLL